MTLEEIINYGDKTKIKYINEFNNEDKIKIINSFSNKSHLMDILFKVDKETQKYIYNLIPINIIKIYSRDILCNEKVELIPNCIEPLQVILLSTLDTYWVSMDLLDSLSDDVKITVYESPNSFGIKDMLLASIKDKNIRMKFIKQLDRRQLFHFINLLKPEYIDSDLIKIIDDPLMLRILKSNIITLDKERIEDIDKNISFGVELESCSLEYLNYRYDVNFFNNTYKSHCDSSVNYGIEVVSPVLHYENIDLNRLEYVCNSLKECGFETDRTCGGHIHLGANYFSNSDEFNLFLELYSRIEDILYIITNKKKSAIRRGTTVYASGSLNIIRKYNIKFDKERIMDIEEHYRLLRTNFLTDIDRYHGLNLKNVGKENKNTIEFRMPNGEINYDEVILNIRLFCKLFMLVKKLVRRDNEDLLMKYNLLLKDYSQKKRFEILISMLFNDYEERKPYIERYNYNKFIFSPVRLTNSVSFFSKNLTKKHKKNLLK